MYLFGLTFLLKTLFLQGPIKRAFSKIWQILKLVGASFSGAPETMQGSLMRPSLQSPAFTLKHKDKIL